MPLLPLEPAAPHPLINGAATAGLLAVAYGADQTWALLDRYADCRGAMVIAVLALLGVNVREIAVRVAGSAWEAAIAKIAPKGPSLPPTIGGAP